MCNTFAHMVQLLRTGCNALVVIVGRDWHTLIRSAAQIKADCSNSQQRSTLPCIRSPEPVRRTAMKYACPPELCDLRCPARVKVALVCAMCSRLVAQHHSH